MYVYVCVDKGGNVPMKGASEHEVVVAGELAHSRVEFAVVD